MNKQIYKAKTSTDDIMGVFWAESKNAFVSSTRPSSDCDEDSGTHRRTYKRVRKYFTVPSSLKAG